MQREDSEHPDWIAAEAALKTARNLPSGPERIEALKRAGQMRYEADRKRREREMRPPGVP